MKRVSNRESGNCVKNQQEFSTNHGSLYGTKFRLGYAAFSYGSHWPLFVFYRGKWYANSDKASRTTSKHYGCAHPGGVVNLRTKGQMRDIVEKLRSASRIRVKPLEKAR